MKNFQRTITLVVTNIIKLAGVYVGVKAGTKTPVEAITMGWSAFAIAGAQLSETTILLLIERFFGQGEKSKSKSAKDEQ